MQKQLYCSLALALSLISCRPAKVEHYKVPKEAPPVVVPTQNDTVSSPLSYTLPSDNWVDQGASGMRKASIKVTTQAEEGDFSIVSLPGQAGSFLDNINRWRGQLELPPVDLETAKKDTAPIEIMGTTGFWLELASKEENKGMLVAQIEQDQSQWFFKLTGSPQLLQAEKAHFQALLKSIALKPASQSPPPQNTPQALPQVTDIPAFSYTLPKGWVKNPSEGMRVLSVQANGTDVSVVVLSGNGGGLLENINRWRAQMQLTPLDKPEDSDLIEKQAVLGTEGYLLELITQERGMLVTLVALDGNTWFFKMTGDPNTVTQEKANFQRFLSSFQLKEASS